MIIWFHCDFSCWQQQAAIWMQLLCDARTDSAVQPCLFYVKINQFSFHLEIELQQTSLHFIVKIASLWSLTFVSWSSYDVRDFTILLISPLQLPLCWKRCFKMKIWQIQMYYISVIFANHYSLNHKHIVSFPLIRKPLNCSCLLKLNTFWWVNFTLHRKWWI